MWNSWFGVCGSFSSSIVFYFIPIPCWFQALGHQAPAVQSDAAQPQEAPTVDPSQQRLMEEQQRRQEAVVQKDRVSVSVACFVITELILWPTPTVFLCCVCLSFDRLTMISPCALQGNAYFKEGKYEAAIECYSKGIEADSMNVLLPANRAMAFLKLEK